MLYLATTSGPAVRSAMLARPDLLGQMLTPDTGNRILGPPVAWAADNGAFGAWRRGVPFDFDEWASWLASRPRTTLFAVVPDVVEDHAGTLELWHAWAPVVRDLGHEPAFALQNGCTPRSVPADARVLFIGGDTEWKLGAAARAIVAELRHRCHVHMGRVNTLQRLRYADAIGCRSADGTTLRYPTANLAPMLRWLGAINAPRLFEVDRG